MTTLEIADERQHRLEFWLLCLATFHGIAGGRAHPQHCNDHNSGHCGNADKNP